jgi:alanyl-tRNA synthetase
MLGNFSFGDYFKEDAIAFGWEFLTKQIGLPKDRLHVTVYQDDDEAERIWNKILGPQANPITRLGEKDNFWSMGEIGPCGPCSEIHIDQGERFGCGALDCGPGCDCDRFLELWNLVFMQFYRDEHGSMTPLPRPSIDTGLGLERLAAVVQGVDSNWETDLFGPIIQRIRELSGVDCSDHDHRRRVATRVIADHSRSAAFLVADGVLPSNEGRGYVLRRILRRALRFGKSLGLEKPFLHDSAGVVVDLMSDAYPELETHRVLMAKVIRSEEERFIETLARGLTLFEEVAANLRRKNQTMVSGDVVFRLYDTYGFPRDLTEDLAREEGFTLDHEGFEKEMSRQRVMARQAWEGMHNGEAAIWRKLLPEKVVTQFSGYTTLTDSATVIAIRKDEALVQKAQSGDSVELVLDRTPFYGESGGQVGDHGIIKSQDCRIEVMDTIKPQPDLIVHRSLVHSGEVKVGDRVEAGVATDLRRATVANHSATHLLQWALRQVLGPHVSQSGSLVDAQRLRFDFTHFSPITSQELRRIEDLVNEKVMEDVDVDARILKIDEAKSQGAIALFGEKYGDDVRLVSIGDFSKELCGGTHARRTGEIGVFKITSETGIAAGVRRIEAVTGRQALTYFRSLEDELRILSERLRGSRGDLVSKLDKLLEGRKQADRELEQLKLKVAGKVAGDILEGCQEKNGIRVLTRIVQDVQTPKDLREYADRVRDKIGTGIALMGAVADGKAMIVAMVTKDLIPQYHAGNLVKKAAEIVGGSGGGRPDMAQAGGPDVSKLQQALESALEAV